MHVILEKNEIRWNKKKKRKPFDGTVQVSPLFVINNRSRKSLMSQSQFLGIKWFETTFHSLLH